MIRSVGEWMGNRGQIVAVLMAVAMVLMSVPRTHAATSQYWDTSDTTGLQAGSGTWSNSNGSPFRNWNDATGTGSRIRWTNGNDAFFDASGTSVITLDTGNLPTANSVTFNGTGYTIQTGTLTLSGTRTITTNVVATINSAIGGTTGFIKAGSANLTLGGTNTVTGTTSINAGTLTLNGSYSSSTSGANSVDVNNTGKLAGTGTISRIVNLNAGGTLSPAGDGTNSNIGTITTGAQNWAGTSTYVWEIKDATAAAGTGYDTLNVSGSLTVNATAASKMTVKITSNSAVSNFNPHEPWQWTIATGTTVNNFDPNAFTLDVSGFVDDNPETNASGFSISQSGGSVRINYVPEPGSVMLVGFAGCAGLMRRRRRMAARAERF